MKSYLWLTLLIAFFALFVLSACGDDDDGGITGMPDISEENFDWDLWFTAELHNQDKNSTIYYVSAYYLGDYTDIDEDDDYYFKIGDLLVELWGDYGDYSGHVELEPGTEYNIEFYKNDQKLSSANLKMPYNAIVDFPETFNYREPFTFTWELPANNSYQWVSMYAYNPDTDEESEEGYNKMIASSARSHTIPANSLEDFGPQTEYSLYFSSGEFKASGRYAFSADSITYWHSYSNYVKSFNKEFHRNIVNSIH